MNVTSSTLAVLRSSGKITGEMTAFARGMGQLFYLHNASETCYQETEQVPNFYRNAWPYFIVFIILENVVLYLEKKPMIRLNDGITSLSHGIIQECGRLIFRGSENALYIYLHENYKILDLAWDSPLTWYTALISVDFCYYWVHRASHEIHILWAQHQVHHSSEEYNLAVGLRQSVLQGWCSFIFYLPMAFFVPPAHFIAHQQFNLLYQFWIHTKTIKTLGPLEYVFNTPQHHRVHHGCNLYCIDKNYGGFFIIWDRIFNTFAAEREKEEIIYGLVFNQPSFNPVFLQVFYNQNVINKFRAMTGYKNKLSAIVKGPSWAPGSPWTGYHDDKINVQGRQKYNVEISTLCNIYAVTHFLIVLVGFHILATNYMVMHPLAVFMFTCCIILTLTTIGMLFDNHQYFCLLEIIRCFLFLIYRQRTKTLNGISFIWMIDTLFGASAFIWILQYLKIIEIKSKNVLNNEKIKL